MGRPGENKLAGKGRVNVPWVTRPGIIPRMALGAGQKWPVLEGRGKEKQGI